MFDIDGTLTDTMDVDVECYEAAIRSVLGIDIPSDWRSLEDVTDASILAVACERRGIPMPDPDAQSEIAEQVGRLLAAQLAQAPHRFQAIPGARKVFEVLEGAGWRVAMATGAWRPSALVKLRGAGIPHEHVPLATCSDHSARVDIIRRAVGALAQAPGEPVVYVGDGAWDGRAATSLGYRFVGVAPSGRDGLLREAGAYAVLEDFSEARSLVEALMGRQEAPVADLSITRGREADLPAVMRLVGRCIEEMQRRGIDQWDDVYPGRERFGADVAARTLHVASAEGGRVIGVFALDEHQDVEYRDVPWAIEEHPVAVVHRLMVDPAEQGRGVARALMRFAEETATSLGYGALRLDAFTLNPYALRLYRGLGYRDAGEVTFRKGRFRCFEKRLREPRGRP